MPPPPPNTTPGANPFAGLPTIFTVLAEREFSMEDKVSGVIRQLKKGEAKIVFDPETDSVTIAVRQGGK